MVEGQGALWVFINKDMGPHWEIGSLQMGFRVLDQLCHPLHWAKPPYWNMVKSHRTEGNGDFSKRCHLGPEHGTSFGNRVFVDRIGILR
jgi:hypothetical protein